MGETMLVDFTVGVAWDQVARKKQEEFSGGVEIFCLDSLGQRVDYSVAHIRQNWKVYITAVYSIVCKLRQTWIMKTEEEIDTREKKEKRGRGREKAEKDKEEEKQGEVVKGENQSIHFPLCPEVEWKQSGGA